MSDSSSDESDIELLKLIPSWDSEEEKDNDIARFTQGRVNHIEVYEDHQFTYMFRLNKTVVENLLLEIFPYLRVTSKRIHATAPLHQLLLTLRYFALGSMLESAADFIGVSKTSAGRIVKDISHALAKLSGKYLFFHSRTAEDFYTIAKFPHVLGTIGSTHVLMHSPESNFGPEIKIKVTVCSMNVQAVCDANLRFMNIMAGGSRSFHDAAIFNKSELKANCENGVYGERWLLGNNAFPCKPYLLTPVINPGTEQEKCYNQAHEKTRQTIERCILAWKRRFPILYSKIRLSTENIQALIIATAILHNICREHDIEDMEPETEIPDYQINFKPQNIAESSPMHEFHKRQSLINTYFKS